MIESCTESNAGLLLALPTAALLVLLLASFLILIATRTSNTNSSNFKHSLLPLALFLSLIALGVLTEKSVIHYQLLLTLPTLITSYYLSQKEAREATKSHRHKSLFLLLGVLLSIYLVIAFVVSGIVLLSSNC